MADSKDISFSTLADSISAQDYDYQTVDLSSSITMASPVYSMPTITIGPSTGGAIGAGYTGVSQPVPSNTVWTTGTSGLNGFGAADIRPSSTISLRGEDADIDINGKSLMKTLEALEERLNMLTPNPELEKEWDELRELGERYRELEKQCKEKSNMWKKLKSMPKPNIKL